jgi:serine/threonine-protein kinase PpkA
MLRLPGLVALVVLSALTPSAHAQDAGTHPLAAKLDQIDSVLDTYQAEIQGQEAVQTPAEGSAAAADAQIQRLNADLAALAQQVQAADRREAAALARIAQATQDFVSDWRDLEPPSAQTGPVSGTPGTPPGTPTPPAPGPDGAAAPSIVPGGPEGQIEITPPVAEDRLDPAVTSPDPVASMPPRILTRPGAVFHDAPGGVAGAEVPVFSVLYVFAEATANQEPWLHVGHDPAGQPAGWIRKRSAQVWKNMLVMRYAPASERRRALFFRQPETIERLIMDFDYETLARDLYRRVETGAYDPKTLVAIEPERAVNQAANPYLMPILDWRDAEFDIGFETTLLELAGVNLETRTQGAQTAARLPGADPTGRTVTPDEMRIGLVFVIDTTRSMSPYIEQSKRFVTSVYERLGQAGLSDRFRFGLIGFRDNMGAAPGVDYVTRVYRDLGPAENMPAFSEQVTAMTISSASTQNWREDALAGLEDAISRMAWDQVDARLVFLITDASARDIGDPLARDPRVGTGTIVGLAEQNNIALFILHLQTEEARRLSRDTEGYDDHLRGQSQYARMQVTGNHIDTKYFRVVGQTEESFRRQLDGIADEVVQVLRTFQGGLTIQPARIDGSPQVGEELLLLSQAPDGLEINEDSGTVVSSVVVNEIFRAQQEYLGTREGTQAPAFYRAWAADRDLVDPRLRPFEVAVFMTRAQISDLAERLDEIVTRLDNKEAGYGEFFSTVRDRSGRAVVDPKIKVLLPAFLEGLPYRSKFLEMTQDMWEAMGAGQEDLLQEVRSKITLYRRLTSSREGWLNLSDRSAENQVYPLPLTLLP